MISFHVCANMAQPVPFCQLFTYSMYDLTIHIAIHLQSIQSPPLPPASPLLPPASPEPSSVRAFSTVSFNLPMKPTATEEPLFVNSFLMSPNEGRINAGVGLA